jgi:hypothetical protein
VPPVEAPRKRRRTRIKAENYVKEEGGENSTTMMIVTTTMIENDIDDYVDEMR